MTGFNTAVGNGKYSLTFNTDNHFYYQHIQQAARDCVDGILPPTTSSPTNADRIRAMSDEELFDFLYTIDLSVCCCPARSECRKFDSCKEAFCAWLRQEVTE